MMKKENSQRFTNRNYKVDMRIYRDIDIDLYTYIHKHIKEYKCT